MDAETGMASTNSELNYNIPFGNVTGMDVGPDSVLWVGTSDGLLRHLPNGSIERITQEADASGNTIGLPGNDVSMVHALPDGSVLVGSRGKGLTHFTHATRSFEALEWTRHFTPICALQQADGSLWIGTEGSGLLHFQNGAFVRQISMQQGLPSNSITSINDDPREVLWVGTNRGLSKVLAESGKVLRNYGPAEGFVGMEVKPNASARARRTWPNGIELGYLVYGTGNGIIMNQPPVSTPKYAAPNLHLAQLRVNLQPHSIAQGHSLSHDQNNLIFDFKAISLLNPEAVRYSVMLEGLEDAWRAPTEQAFVHYTSVPPGNYTLKVRATNGAGVETTEPVTYAFTIHPPFWQTWWFYLLCTIVLAASIFGWIKYRERALLAEKERLEQQVAERTAEVVQQKEELAVANDQLEEKNRDIMDSIRYAERIQRAILPLEETMKQHLEDVFVFFQPKDIVSGDFYWFAQAGSRVYFSAIDCTGHGVPGAFVSLIGNNGLQKAVMSWVCSTPMKFLARCASL